MEVFADSSGAGVEKLDLGNAALLEGPGVCGDSGEARESVSVEAPPQGGENGSLVPLPEKKIVKKKSEFPFNESERYTKIEGFSELSVQQKKILFAHLNFPASDYRTVSSRSGVPRAEVVRFMHSKLFESIISEVIKQRKLELRYAALNALESCLTNPKLKMNAALRLLEDSGDLSREVKPKTDGRVTVFWKGNTNILKSQPVVSNGNHSD